jgi:hypothetical protein
LGLWGPYFLARGRHARLEALFRRLKEHCLTESAIGRKKDAGTQATSVVTDANDLAPSKPASQVYEAREFTFAR